MGKNYTKWVLEEGQILYSLLSDILIVVYTTNYKNEFEKKEKILKNQ
jgi:hypothetical protein